MNSLDLINSILNNTISKEDLILISPEFLSAAYLIKYLEFGDEDTYQKFIDLFFGFSFNQKLMTANYVKVYYQDKSEKENKIKIKKRG